MFIAMLIMWYLLHFFLTRNQGFLYGLSQYSNTPAFTYNCNILIMIHKRSFRIGKLEACQASWSTIWIFCENMILGYILLSFNMSYTKHSFHHINISRRNSCSFEVKSELIFNVFFCFGVNLQSWENRENLDII